MKRALLVASTLLVAPAAVAAPGDAARERAKGATVEVLSSDAGLRLQVVAPRATVGGQPARIRLTGRSAGGSVDVWLSTFRYRRPDGTTDHVAGANVSLRTGRGQTAFECATALARTLDGYRRPYVTRVTRDGNAATLHIQFRAQPGR